MTPASKLIFIGKPLVLALNEELLSLEQNPEVNVVILTGRIGSPSFAVGANINEIGDTDQIGHMFND